MKKYVIYIGLDNKEVSAKVQEKLFSVGFSWWSGGTRPLYTDAKYIYIEGRNSRYMMYGKEDYNAHKCINVDGYIMLSAEYVLEHADKLDGATVPKPVKKMTVAEIAAELGYDIEIVKVSACRTHDDDPTRPC